MKILHIFYSSLPSVTGGDIRNRDVVTSQKGAGVDVIAITSPFQPPFEPGKSPESVQGIPHYRTFSPQFSVGISEQDRGLLIKVRKILRLPTFAREVARLAAAERVTHIHAHSTFFAGLAGYYAAKRCKVPFVYEVRSLWEERAVLQRPSIKNRLISSLVRQLETLSMRIADHVVVISEGLRQEISSRGLAPSKISVIGNAADLRDIPDSTATYSAKQAHEWVFGYVGNISQIEGLDLMIDAVRGLRAKGWKNPVRIFGDGPSLVEYRGRSSDIADFHWMGRFDPNERASVYGQIDVVVNPRRRSPLTDKVTPLKPLEAMAFKKPMIVSSVGGMSELVTDKVTGFIFEADNVVSLAQALEGLIAHAQLDEIVGHARTFVEQHRSWHQNGIRYRKIYEAVSETR